MNRHTRILRTVAATLALATLLPTPVGATTPPGSASPDSAPRRAAPGTTVTLVAYDSFPTQPESPVTVALAEFTAATNIAVRVVTAGDTGTMITKAVLTSGNPEGDVMWGVDNTFLSAAEQGTVFEGQPTLVDTGDVCVNFDRAWFERNDIAPPATLDDLIKPEYRDLLVVEDPSTSSPGLAFLLATVAAFGEAGWQGYWASLRANGVQVVDSWTTAYYEAYTVSGGDRPMVVSYGSSPPVEIVFAESPIDQPYSGVASGTCFHQEEYAGVLRGTKNAAAAVALVEFLAGERFQAELPLNLFVYPANDAVVLPEVFTKFGVRPDHPYTLDPAEIEANRQRWQDTWTSVVVR